MAPSKDLLPTWVLSWRSYILATVHFILSSTSEVLQRLGITTVSYFPFDSLLTASIIYAFGLLLLKICILPSRFGICWRAYFLGGVLNLGLTLAAHSQEFCSFGMYCVVMSFFHWSEYMTQAVYNPDTTTVESYMLYHSHAYIIAVVASLIEYWLEWFVQPEMKSINAVSNIGMTIIVFGEALRKSSMITAKSNFNHYVQHDKADDHELVTHGVYSLFRLVPAGAQSIFHTVPSTSALFLGIRPMLDGSGGRLALRSCSATLCVQHCSWLPPGSSSPSVFTTKR